MNTLKPMQPADLKRGSPVEYLTFELGPQLYGVLIGQVREIRSCESVVPIPSAPPFVKGVLYLREMVVPIIDLRLKFGLEAIRFDAFTVMVVLDFGDRTIGIVVDCVSDVVSLSETQIRKPPDFGNGFDPRFLRGLASIDQRLLFLVDMELLVDRADLALIDVGALQEGAEQAA